MTTALPVAYYLTEMSGEPSRRGGRAPIGGEGSSDIAAQISDAHARGILEARAAAQVETDAALAAQAAAFEKKLAAERQKWAAEQGALLGQLLSSSMDDLERRIADQASRILVPIISEQSRVKAIEELSALLNSLLAKGEYAKVSVSGPNDLISAMEGRLGAYEGVSFSVTESVDVTVRADETIIETQLGAWANAIERDGA